MPDRDVETIRDLIPRFRVGKLLSVCQDYGPAVAVIYYFLLSIYDFQKSLVRQKYFRFTIDDFQL